MSLDTDKIKVDKKTKPKKTIKEIAGKLFSVGEDGVTELISSIDKMEKTKNKSGPDLTKRAKGGMINKYAKGGSVKKKKKKKVAGRLAKRGYGAAKK